MSSQELARRVALVISDLENRGYGCTGPLREAARRLLDQPDPDDNGGGDGSCGWCGGPVVRQRRGRPPVYCSTPCRRASWRHRERNRDEMRP